MTLRATQHYVETLELGDSQLRATQAYVESVLIGDSQLRATQHYVEIVRQFIPPIEENLGISDSFVANLDVSKSISHTLGITDQLDRFNRKLSHTLSLVDAITPFFVPGDFQPIEHTISFSQTVSEGSNKTIIDALSLSQTLGVIGPVNESAQDVLGLEDGVHYCFGAPWAAISITDTLGITDVVGIGIPLIVSNTLTMVDSTARVDTIFHELGLIQSVSAGKGSTLVSLMVLNHQLDTQNDFNRGLTHTNIVQDAMAYYIDSPCAKKQYNRFEGSGSGVGIQENVLTFDANFVLETLSGTKTKLSLRSPETDDKRRIGFSRVNRETRGGELNVFSDPVWPKVETLLFTIVAITDGKGNCPDTLLDLFSFIQNNLGLEILLHDWEGISWRGVVITPNEVATEDRDGYWTFSFEFEGSPLDGSQGDQNLTITQAIGLNADWNRSFSNTMSLSQNVVVSGILQESLSNNMSLVSTANVQLDSTILSDNFSGGSGTDLHGLSPDVGSSTWSAHTNYKADGSNTAINSGAYYPFVPVSGTQYEILWKPRTMTHSDGLASWFFLGEGLNSNPDSVGVTAWGRFDPTTLKVGFGIRRISGTQLNTCRLGDNTDGLTDNADMSDATLKAQTVDIDLRVDLDTRLGTGKWKSTWYAKKIADSVWTQVRPATDLISEDITMVGWSNDNSTTVVDMFTITVTEKVSL